MIELTYEKIEEMVSGELEVSLADFTFSQKDINELVVASIRWLGAVGEPRPGSPADAVFEVLRACYWNAGRLPSRDRL